VFFVIRLKNIQMHGLESKVPPPVVAIIVAAGMWAAAKFGHSFAPTPLSLKLAAAFIAALGGAADIAGLVAFRRAKTTVNPLKPETSTALVASGIYALTRNPMYLGMLLILLAWALYLASVPALIGPVAFVLYITRFQIIPEERALSSRFGVAFTEYAAKVRRWI
jgi:protein-S-isoprenylcysteine O-methyltransferase Ste14